MKKLFFVLFVGISLSGLSQEKTTGDAHTQTGPVRSSTSSVKAVASPLPYDVNDKYMGRKEEFLNNLTVAALPSDFPVYDKKMSLDDYNQVVDSYYRSHTAILKESVRQKLIQK